MPGIRAGGIADFLNDLRVLLLTKQVRLIRFAGDLSSSRQDERPSFAPRHNRPVSGGSSHAFFVGTWKDLVPPAI